MPTQEDGSDASWAVGTGKLQHRQPELAAVGKDGARWALARSSRQQNAARSYTTAAILAAARRQLDATGA